MATLDLQEVYEDLIKDSGCVYGGFTKGQSEKFCRAKCAPGQKYCPRHLMILDAKKDKPATRRRS